MKAVTKTLVLQSFISNGWACCTPGYCTSTSSDTLTGKMGKTVILAVFTCFSKKAPDLQGGRNFFSAPPLIRAANWPLFPHALSMQRIVPLMTWQVAGSRDLSISPEWMDLGKTVDSVTWKCSLVSRAILLLKRTKIVHFRNTSSLTLPVLNTTSPCWCCVAGIGVPAGGRVLCPTPGRRCRSTGSSMSQQSPAPLPAGVAANGQSCRTGVVGCFLSSTGRMKPWLNQPRACLAPFPKKVTPNLPGRVSLRQGRPTSWKTLPDLHLPFNFTARQLGQLLSFCSCYFDQKGDDWQLALGDLEFNLMLFGIFEFHNMRFKRGLSRGVPARNLPWKIDGGQ